ncbi:MAG: SulP family inorganic anion transporter [Collinsella sp.]
MSIALAIASGVGPEQGLYTAIVAGFIIALLGGSCGADLGSHRRVRHHRGGHRRLERYGRPGGRDHHRRRAADPHGRLSPGHASSASCPTPSPRASRRASR